jgi:deoxyribodipyrimidine photo-lyase
MSVLYEKLVKKIKNFDAKKYSYSRNYIDGEVSRLSPYISRGFISTSQVFEILKINFSSIKEIEKFVQELAWRDYFQLTWNEKNVEVNLKENISVKKIGIPSPILNAQTSIKAIDNEILNLYKKGYMHNHFRMYIASLICNFSNCHFLTPSKWMYYYLLDGDIGSNALNWQWVSGASRNKKYYFNQENLNKYSRVLQQNTFIDVDYSLLEEINPPESFTELTDFNLSCNLPNSDDFDLDNSKPLCIYNYYNTDPYWKKNLDCNRILLLEPSIFKKYPVCDKAINFLLKLSHEILGIKIFTGEFSELTKNFQNTIYYKQHPLNSNYRGVEDSRDWLSSVKGYHPSFFSFWNKAKKELKY